MRLSLYIEPCLRDWLQLLCIVSLVCASLSWFIFSRSRYCYSVASVVCNAKYCG